MNRYHTYFLTLGHHVVNGFLGGLGNGAHGYDHAVSLGMTVVVEQVIFAACDGGNLAHVVLYDFGNGIVELVA